MVSGSEGVTGSRVRDEIGSEGIYYSIECCAPCLYPSPLRALMMTVQSR